MPTVNYYLKKPERNSPLSLIYLQFKYKGKKLVYSFGQKINPIDWSKERKRVKSNRETILNGLYAMNDLLDRLEKACIDFYRQESMNGIPPVAALKFRLDSFTRKLQGHPDASPFYELFDRFITGEITTGGKKRSPNTLKSYATTKTHLTQFDTHTRYHVNFDNIGLHFLSVYTDFLRDELKLQPGSIAKDIAVIRSVMDVAMDAGYTTNLQWLHKNFR